MTGYSVDDIFGQHTVARSNGNGVVVDVRIPISDIRQARASFSVDDFLYLKPLLDLRKQPYQVHIFNGGNDDAYITNVPFGFVQQLVWYLQQNPKEKNRLLAENAMLTFGEYQKTHSMPQQAGKVELHPGHEKYGLFDLMPANGKSFAVAQLHRLALYGAFLREMGDHREEHTDWPRPATPLQESTLMDDVQKSIGAMGVDQDRAVFSILEAATLLTEGENSRLNGITWRVSEQEQHPIPTYVGEHQGRRVFRTIDPNHPQADKIRKRLESLVRN